MAKKRTITKSDKNGQYSFTIEIVNVGDLVVDGDYQRVPNRPRIKAIAKKFDWHEFGVVEVSQREDESITIVDGQHRVEALRELGWHDIDIEVVLYTDLTQADEAKIFVARNMKGVRPSPIANIKAEEVAGDPEAVAIFRVVKALSLRIDTKGTKRTIKAVSALRAVYNGTVVGKKCARADILKETLLVLRDAWIDDQDDESKRRGAPSVAFDNKLVRGMGAVLWRYRDRIDLDRMISKVKRFGAGDMLKAIQHMQDDWYGGRCSVRDAAATRIVEAYNYRSKKGNLPPWMT